MTNLLLAELLLNRAKKITNSITALQDQNPNSQSIKFLQEVRAEILTAVKTIQFQEEAIKDLQILEIENQFLKESLVRKNNLIQQLQLAEDMANSTPLEMTIAKVLAKMSKTPETFLQAIDTVKAAAEKQLIEIKESSLSAFVKKELTKEITKTFHLPGYSAI